MSGIYINGSDKIHVHTRFWVWYDGLSNFLKVKIYEIIIITTTTIIIIIIIIKTSNH